MTKLLIHHQAQAMAWYRLLCIVMIGIAGLASGCAQWRDVSREQPYSQYVGRYYQLQKDSSLWPDGSISEPTAPRDINLINAIPLASLPQGTMVRLDQIKRKRELSLGGAVYSHVQGVVSLADSSSGTKPTRGTVSLWLLGIDVSESRFVTQKPWILASDKLTQPPPSPEAAPNSGRVPSPDTRGPSSH
jgi:hypothetical protein